MGLIPKLLILGSVYYLLKVHLRLEDKLNRVHRENWSTCVLSWFDEEVCLSSTESNEVSDNLIIF